MQYMCLIYEDENVVRTMNDAERGQMFGAYQAFTDELKAAGALVGGEALQNISTATTVRVRNGDTVHTDGPFAETKEQLGGYYIVEAANLDEALRWAAKIPASKTGSIEVRPVMVFDM